MQYLKKKNQKPLYEALQKVKEGNILSVFANSFLVFLACDRSVSLIFAVETQELSCICVFLPEENLNSVFPKLRL